jgi:hypothetical protein
MAESTAGRGRVIRRWRQLAPAGQRRIGEFVSNMFLGVAASLLTLVVIPSFAGRGPSEAWIIVGGLLLAFGSAIFSVFVRVFTEERDLVEPMEGPGR